MHFSKPKFHDCRQSGSGAELYIVEGDSASSTVAQVRDAEFQALFAMQGKPMNATKNSLRQLLANAQFAALLKGLKIRLREVDADSKGEPIRCRFGKIVLLFDPDADGIHARTLMLLFFYRWLPEWLEEGLVFDTHAPQWEITWRSMQRPAFAATPEHMRLIRDDLVSQGAVDVKWKRFRGLGSMDGSIVQTECVDPATRTFQPLSIGHAEQALALFEQMRQL